MRVPLSWLGDYVDHGVDPTDRAGVRRLADALDSLGLVVESIERVGEGLDGVVLARVAEIHAIDGADKIRRVVVDTGRPGEPTTVVCGAWNFAVGDVVPLATVGTVLPGGMAIARRKLRGVVSDGMLCSPAELGLDGDSAGILVLDPGDVGLGGPLAEHLGIEVDVVFDIAIEPNRPDCLSMTGVARDLAARIGAPFRVPAPRVVASGAPAADLASVRTEDGGLCPSIGARVLTGVRVLPSAGRVARRLALAGMRPVNCVVDASNYVMLELGRPNHPYDLDQLGGSGILARAARAGEELTTLDGTMRRLGRAIDARGVDVEVTDGLICDMTDRPVGLAGVMGGLDSEITGATTRVLLEVARFDPVSIARTAKRQGLRSEASVRFERGLDPTTTALVADRFVELVTEAAVAAGVPAPVLAPGLLIDEPEPFRPRRVALRVKRLNDLLGTSLTAAEVTALLVPIGFAVGAPAGSPPAGGPPIRSALDAVEVTVPGFRPDVTREIDLVEEVARHHGYDRIAPTERRSPHVGRLRTAQLERRAIRRILTGLGAHEAWTAPIVDPTMHETSAEGSASLLRLANPMAREESALRAHLLPGLLGALRHNVSHRNGEIRLFEIGHVFAPAASGSGLPDEHDHLGLVLAGEGDDAATAVRAWRALAEGLRVDTSLVEIVQPLSVGEPLGAGSHPSRSGLILGRTVEARGGPGGPVAPGSPVGVLGEVAPDELARHGMPAFRVGWLVVDLDRLLGLGRRDAAATVVSRYPSSDIDLSFVVDDQVSAGEVEAVLRVAGGPLCESVRLIDIYRSAALPAASRGLTWRLRFCAPDHTLGEGELAGMRSASIIAAERRPGVRLRS